MKRLALLLAALAIPAAAQDKAPGPHNRAEATAVVAGLRKVVDPHGFQGSETIPIGGIRQVVTIRTQDLRNPVLIYLHGGPGFVETPIGWWYDTGWAEYFTVVHWDQRGAGKTYVANDPKTLTPETLTIDRYQRDAEEVVQWARKRFGKQRVFVLGHSWGSLLGLRLAQAHPEWLHAYIGMGQGTDFPESERRGWAWTMAQAKAANNAEAIRDLQSIAPYAPDDRPVPVDHIMLQRKWLGRFGGAAWNRQTGGEFEFAAMKLSPDYSDEDLTKAFAGQPAVTKALLPKVLATDISSIRDLKVPLFLLLGRHDINLSSAVASEWFATVRAPEKHLIWFERSGHHITSEEPGKVLDTLVHQVRPVAERAGDVAPEG